VPSKCQLRQSHAILLRNAAEYPAFWAFFLLVVRVVMLGNLPGALARPPLGTRIRLTVELAPAFRRTSDAALKAWIPTHRLLVLFMLREYFLYMVEADLPFDRLRARSTKWTAFKVLVRMANAEWRRMLAQSTARDPKAPICWDSIEFTVGDDDGDTDDEDEDEARSHSRSRHATSTGLLVNYHERSSTLFTKLKKDRWEGIMIKKFTAAERLMHFDMAALQQWLAGDGRIEAFHLAAWYAAQRSQTPGVGLRAQAMIETRWLKALGMTREGFENVRRWQFEYQLYDTADDNYKAKAQHMYASCPRDVFIVKTYLRLVDDYRRERVTMLSVEQTRAQILAVRCALSLEPWAATPPRAGWIHYCTGCQAWAHTTLRPTPELLGTLTATPGASAPTAAAWQSQPRTRFSADALQQLAYCMPQQRQRTATDGTQGADAGTAAPPTSAIAVSSVHGAYLNPFDGRLYCRRLYHKQGAKFFVVPLRIGRPAAARPSTAAAAAAAAAVVNSSEDAQDAEDGDDDIEEDDADADAPKEEAAGDDKQWLRAHGQWLQRLADHAQHEQQPPPQLRQGESAEDISDLVKGAHFSCLRPLVAVDMIGVIRRQRYADYALCVYCGHLTEVLNCNVTNAGISCGRHPLYSEFPNYHRIWASLRMAPTLFAQAMQQVTRRPPAPCIVCGTPSETRLPVYDLLLRFGLVGLCVVHKRPFETLLPLRATDDCAIPPIRVDTLLQRLSVFLKRR
jgi:hypothetical protein